jgi:hypothetical protein
MREKKFDDRSIHLEVFDGVRRTMRDRRTIYSEKSLTFLLWKEERGSEGSGVRSERRRGSIGFSRSFFMENVIRLIFPNGRNKSLDVEGSYGSKLEKGSDWRFLFGLYFDVFNRFVIFYGRSLYVFWLGRSFFVGKKREWVFSSRD